MTAIGFALVIGTLVAVTKPGVSWAEFATGWLFAIIVASLLVVGLWLMLDGVTA